MPNSYVGQRVRRTEDPRLRKGLAHYVDDIELPGTLHVAFVRSYYAHANITGIDTSAAVVATDRYAARDAVDQIVVDYEDLPVVSDVEAAATCGPVIHDAFSDNIAYKMTAGEGDIDAAFASAE